MIFKRCEHRRGRQRNDCAHPWYGSFKSRGQPRVRVSLSKWIGEPVSSKQQALAVFDELKRAVRAGTFDLRGHSATSSTGGALTLQQLATEHLDKLGGTFGDRAGTYWSRLKPALATFGDTPIAQISTAAIDDWKVALERPRVIHGEHRPPSTATVNRAVAELRYLLNWAVRRDLLASSPFLKGGLPAISLDHEDNHRDRRVTEAEETLLLHHASPLLRGLIIIALDTGARRGEMLAIRVGDADLVHGEITLRGSTTKSGRTRVVPVSTLRLRAVIEWYQMNAEGQVRPSDQPLVCKGAGDPIATFRRAWEDAVLRANGHTPARETKRPNVGALLAGSRRALAQIDLHWHDLRHEYASRLAERGVTLTEVAALLGHASVQTTERYISHSRARLKTSVTALERGGVFDPTPGRTSLVSRYGTQNCE
jgi:integrase